MTLLFLNIYIAPQVQSRYEHGEGNTCIQPRGCILPIGEDEL